MLIGPLLILLRAHPSFYRSYYLLHCTALHPHTLHSHTAPPTAKAACLTTPFPGFRWRLQSLSRHRPTRTGSWSFPALGLRPACEHNILERGMQFIEQLFRTRKWKKWFKRALSRKQTVLIRDYSKLRVNLRSNNITNNINNTPKQTKIIGSNEDELPVTFAFWKTRKKMHTSHSPPVPKVKRHQLSSWSSPRSISSAFWCMFGCECAPRASNASSWFNWDVESKII